MGEGSTRFLFGAVLGATTGFVAGFFAATPAARSAGKSTVGGLGDYTRVLGREKYLEHEIEELRDQITRLEQRID